MDLLALFGIVFITTALVFYSLGVWGEFFKKDLFYYHVIFFFIGLTCDFLGTSLMFLMADELVFDIHAVSGAIAIILMAIHAYWAYKTEKGGTPEQKSKFHRYSIFVWLFWLLPYFYPSVSMMS